MYIYVYIYIYIYIWYIPNWLYKFSIKPWARNLNVGWKFSQRSAVTCKNAEAVFLPWQSLYDNNFFWATLFRAENYIWLDSQ